MMKKFPDDPNIYVFTCKHVVHDKLPILYVTHDKDDGSWQFLCGQREHKEEHAMIIALYEIIDIDATTMQIADMPVGFEAIRESKESEWIIKEINT